MSCITNCVLTDGYVLGCRDNIGGVAEVYIGEWNGTTTQYALDSDCVITGVTSGATFYKFEQDIEVASYQETGNFSTENGTAFYEQVLEITLHKMNAELRNKLVILGQGKWRIIVKDQRGTYWQMGYQNPIRVTSSTPGFGKAYGDLNGAIVTFTGKEPEIAKVIEESVALSLIA
jgi:hypothetical protein